MKKHYAIVLFILLTTLLVLAASTSPSPVLAGQQARQPDQSSAKGPQNTQPGGEQSQPPAPPKEDKDVVKIGVTLVQVDAVVTDRKGRYVTDLRPEDFDIFEDGKRQHITNFSYVTTATLAPAAAEKGKLAKGEVALPPVPMRLRPEQVRRTIALVVDDLGLSFESTAFVRDALKKFVDEQMQAGDLVAIIRTGAGVGALQQFTADRRLLYAAIDRIRWNMSGRGGLSTFEPLSGAELSAGNTRQGEGGRSMPRAMPEGRDDVTSGREALDRFRHEVFTVGTLGAMNYVVRGLRQLPGRKSIILFSDGFALYARPGTLSAGSRYAGVDWNDRTTEALKRLTDLANRASVVIYTIDARGLPTFGLTAADNTSGMSPAMVDAAVSARMYSFSDSQQGLQQLADLTGGIFVRNANDLNRGIRRVLNDQQGYYLIGYVPEASSFRPARAAAQFHKISVKVKPAGFSVRSRTGFYGVSDEAAQAAPQTRAQQLFAALSSPFTSGDIRLKLTSLFAYHPKAGAFMRSMLHIDPRQITFSKEPDGQYKGVISVVAFTFGDSGQVIDREGREYTFRIPADLYETVMRQGLLYNINVAIKKPGAYQLRVAVRDAVSEKVGSANQFIEVPDIGKKRLALSGLVLEGRHTAKQVGMAAASIANRVEGAISEGDSEAGPSMRILRPGMELSYGFAIYNPVVDRATGQPHLEAQVRLLRDGKEVFAGQQTPIGMGNSTDTRQVLAGGTMKLGPDMPPGEYVLQVIITDRLAKEKYSRAAQWIDFEVVK